MRWSWVHPDIAERVRTAVRNDRPSWEDVFAEDTLVVDAAPPSGVDVTADVWPRLAEHVARAARVRQVVDQKGIEAASLRFAKSPFAVERVALIDASGAAVDDVPTIEGILACPVDEWVAYGQFLSRLVELGAAKDPAGTALLFERFVAAATAVRSDQPSWPERLSVARDGLAALYVRIGRADDAEALYHARFAEEPSDTTIPIGAGRAFLEAGDTSRAVSWLERAIACADRLGRAALGDRLRVTVSALRARLN